MHYSRGDMVPKIIDNIEQKIYENALALFAARGYNQVSMKDVAEASGIAVGTLYNYYSNKMDLFLNVFEEHINQVYTKLREIIEKDKEPVEFITVLYDEFVKISGFSEELVKGNILHENNDLISKIRDKLVDKTRNLVEKIRKNHEEFNLDFFRENEQRVIRLILLAVIDFAREFPEEREENIAFIKSLIKKI